jgi:hypothetical protein
MLFFIVMMLTFSNATFAVINGSDLNKELIDTHSFVALTFKVQGLPEMPCSGAYVGQGQVLVASHCILMNDYPLVKPEICLAKVSLSEVRNSNVDEAQICFKEVDYDVLFPPQVEEGPKAPTRKLRRVIRIPKPDIVLIQIKTDLLNRLLDFLPLPLSQDTTAIVRDPNWQLKIIGQGCTAYTEPAAELPNPGIGNYRFGDVNLSFELTSELEYFSIWTKDNKNVGLCWGDSGGALIATNTVTKKIVQLAVNSSTRYTYDRATGYTASVKSTFSRLDQISTLEWLKQVVKK